MVTGSQQGQSGQTQQNQYGIFGVNSQGQVIWLQNASSQGQANQQLDKVQGQAGGQNFEQLMVLEIPAIKQLQHA